MSAVDEYKQFSVLLKASASATGATDGLATMVRADAAVTELEAEKNLYFTKMQEEYKRAEQAEAELAKTEWMLRKCMRVSTQYMAEHMGVEWHESDVDEALEHLNEAWAERGTE